MGFYDQLQGIATCPHMLNYGIFYKLLGSSIALILLD